MLVVADGQAVRALVAYGLETVQAVVVVKRVSWVNHPNPEKVLPMDLGPSPFREKSNRTSLIIVPLPLRFAT